MEEQEKPAHRTINVAYRQSPGYRNVFANGVYGGFTPTGEMFLAIYTQRMHLPDTGVIEIGPDNIPTGEKHSVLQGIARDIEVGVTMELTTAVAFHDWLTQKLQLIGAIKPQDQTAVGEPK